MNDVISGLIAYLFEELKYARDRAVTPADEFQLQVLIWRAGRHTRRLERMADALVKLDAETVPQ